MGIDGGISSVYGSTGTRYTHTFTFPFFLFQVSITQGPSDGLIIGPLVGQTHQDDYMRNFLGGLINDHSTCFFRTHMQPSLGFGMLNSMLLLALFVSTSFDVIIKSQ